MSITNEGFVETTQTTDDGKRVYYVNPKGLVCDLPPTGRPPLIASVAVDGVRIVVIGQGETSGQDIQPNNVGLTGQSVAALKKYVFKGKG